jgi:DHA1 family tetracycline resistance protein-like MFS transporter
MAVVQGVLVRSIVPVLGERKALLVGLGIGALGYIAIGAATQGWMIYALIALLSLGGIAGPAVQAIITSEVGAKEQGELQGNLNSLSGLAAIIGPLFATTLLAHFAPEAADPRIPGAPFYAAGAVSLVGLLLAMRVFAALPSRNLGAPVAAGSEMQPEPKADEPVVGGS